MIQTKSSKGPKTGKKNQNKSPRPQTPKPRVKVMSASNLDGPAVSYATESSTRTAPSFEGATVQGDMRVRIRHREYISDILGSVAYTNSLFSINPGLPSIFPWLSTIANNFESYKFKKLGFEFRTYSATSASGKVVLSVDYDAADPAPTTKQQQLQERSKIDGPTWMNLDLCLDNQDLNKFGTQRFVRSIAVGNTDIKTYDIGNLCVGVSAQANTNAIGELFVYYDIELMTPQPAAGGGDIVLENSYKMTNSTSLSNTSIFGTGANQTWTPVNPGANYPSASGNTITIPGNSSWLVEVLLTGTSLGQISNSVINFSNYTIGYNQANSAGTNSCFSFICNNTSNVIQQSAWTSAAASVATCVVRFAPYNFTQAG